LTSKTKIVFNTSGLHFCIKILGELKEECEITLSPLVATHFPQTINCSIEELANSDKEYVYQMIRRYLNKELATNYKRGRKTDHAGEFESIALAKRLGTYIVIHDQRARQWAKMEKVQSLHPVDVPDIFRHKLPKEKMRIPRISL
jgi:predicted nucleic acid-binding protein